MGMFDKLRGLIGRGREEAPQEAEPQQPPAPAPAPAAPAEAKKPGRLRRLFSRKPKEKPQEQAPPAPAPTPAPEPSPAGGGEAPPPAPPAGGGGGEGEAGGEDEYADAPDSMDVSADGEWVTSGSTWDGQINARLNGSEVKAFLRAMDHGDTATAAQLVADAASARDGNTFGQALTPGECTVDFFYNSEF